MKWELESVYHYHWAFFSKQKDDQSELQHLTIWTEHWQKWVSSAAATANKTWASAAFEAMTAQWCEWRWLQICEICNEVTIFLCRQDAEWESKIMLDVSCEQRVQELCQTGNTTTCMIARYFILKNIHQRTEVTVRNLTHQIQKYLVDLLSDDSHLFIAFAVWFQNWWIAIFSAFMSVLCFAAITVSLCLDALAQISNFQNQLKNNLSLVLKDIQKFSLGLSFYCEMSDTLIFLRLINFMCSIKSLKLYLTQFDDCHQHSWLSVSLLLNSWMLWSLFIEIVKTSLLIESQRVTLEKKSVIILLCRIMITIVLLRNKVFWWYSKRRWNLLWMIS